MKRDAILDQFLNGGPLHSLDIVDCHSHMGLALYMNVPDGNADGLVRVLDAMGVATACVSHTIGMISDWKLGNDLLMEACHKYPQRIFGYAVYNPRYPAQMPDELDRCAKAGLRGLKIHPDFHKIPANSPLYDLAYQRAVAERRVILVHYGSSPAPFAGFNLYHDVLRRFPKMFCILAHSLPGFDAVDIAVEYFAKYENVYYDLANAFAAGVVEYACQRLGADRLLYGTDGCWGDMAKRLGVVCVAQVSETDKKKILGENMRRIMRECA